MHKLSMSHSRQAAFDHFDAFVSNDKDGVINGAILRNKGGGKVASHGEGTTNANRLLQANHDDHQIHPKKRP